MAGRMSNVMREDARGKVGMKVEGKARDAGHVVVKTNVLRPIQQLKRHYQACHGRCWQIKTSDQYDEC